MSIKTVLEKLLHNWPRKILCLVVAIFLYIFHQTSLIDKKNFVVPLVVEENGIVMHVQQIPSSITISVKANSDDISNIHASDFKAKIDLSDIVEDGVFDVPVNIDISDSVKQLETLEIKVKPSDRMSVKVEQKIAKFIPLEASISGEPAHGYKVESVILDPSTVCVVGPGSIVNNIKTIPTDKVTVNNAEVNFATETKYLAINKLISVQDKGPYTATVVISAQETKKIFNDVPVLPSLLAENLMIDGNIASVSVTLSGTIPVLEDYYIPKSAVAVDLSNITEPGEYELPLIVSLPSSIKVDNLSVDKVLVKIVEKEELSEQPKQE